MFDEDNRDRDRRQDWPQRIVLPPGSSEDAAVIVNLGDEADEIPADPVVFSRDATQIVITTSTGKPVDTIDVPAIELRRSETDPTWLAMRDAEEATR